MRYPPRAVSLIFLQKESVAAGPMKTTSGLIATLLRSRREAERSEESVADLAVRIRSTHILPPRPYRRGRGDMRAGPWGSHTGRDEGWPAVSGRARLRLHAPVLPRIIQ